MGETAREWKGDSKGVLAEMGKESLWLYCWLKSGLLAKGSSRPEIKRFPRGLRAVAELEAEAERGPDLDGGFIAVGDEGWVSKQAVISAACEEWREETCGLGGRMLVSEVEQVTRHSKPAAITVESNDRS